MKRILKVLSVAVGLLGLAGFYSPPGSHADSDEKDKDKVQICHMKDTSAEKTLWVPASAVAGHESHGDTEGDCEDDKGR